MTFDIAKVVRPKILNLEPYRCARDDFKEGILLDANENPYGPTIDNYDIESLLHRYPDPHQLEFKKLLSEYRNKTSVFKDQDLKPLDAENLCLGVGSDESIDALIRACCVPGKEKILIAPATYGMYTICSEINDVEFVKVPLQISGEAKFQIDEDKILQTLQSDPSIKLVFITSPGNPTGTFVDVSRIEKIVSQWQTGLVVVDEAYVDFVEGPGKGSLAPLATKYENLAVLQTLSKSFGLAGIRLGVTYVSKPVSKVLNSMKAPYNISYSTAEVALKAVQPENLKLMEKNAVTIKEERTRVLKELTASSYVTQLGGLDANFVLLNINNGDNALTKKLYEKLAIESGVITRYRGNEPGCAGGLRISIGTKEQNDVLIREFNKHLAALLA
ncbi:unnamed protein product [Kluyveromyces dobzhanskii CBS 2104]|uniref:histidinol-phosphate transaminase n=1 Tax=Kluyveromyces dobzhanskii CBS 2104 TaxID=1427455 RepID=A0A0A8L985_9SACH|nr:unnamed protein product [Kluyveromyces dobzhanskii CBS 2104]